MYRFEDDAISVADSVLRSFLATELKSMLQKTIKDEQRKQRELEEMDFTNDLDGSDFDRESEFDNQAIAERSAKIH